MTEGVKLTRAERARISATLRKTYQTLTPKDVALLERAADEGLLERFWPTGTFGKLFTRYSISDLGRAILNPESAK